MRFDGPGGRPVPARWNAKEPSPVNVRLVRNPGPTPTSAPSGLRSRQASIKDVASLAGVSSQTISRVVNGSPNVRPSTRSRVIAAMGELDYRPNRAARVLSTRRSQTVGVLAETGGSRYGQAGTVRAVEEAARERGYYTAVVHLASASPSAISAAARDLLAHEVEGAVIVAPQAELVSSLAPLLWGIPIVTARMESRSADGTAAFPDGQDAGARMMMRYLIRQGHQRIVHIAGPPDWCDARDLLSAYEAELRSSGLPPLPLVFGDWSADSGYAAGRSLVRDAARAGGPEPGFTAVFAASDQMALGLIHALREARLEVPGDVSVAGVGDIPEAAHFWPPLTTVRQDLRELGRACVARLIDAIRGAADASPAAGPRPAPSAGGPSLAIRNSVKPAHPGLTDGTGPRWRAGS
jgi:DNA-binding LacI/PurR family transcriptional regulator